jgi:D-3-phosphoglycerate dehydrogenase
MRVLITTTSFVDTPGKHQEKLASLGYEIDTLRGPLRDSVLLPIIGNYDALICGDDEITLKVVQKGAAGKLKVISKYGIGLDKIDVEAVNAHGITLCNTPGVNHIAVSEHIIALILAFYKNIHLEYLVTKDSRWERMIGHEVYGKKIGILGLGRIGKELAVRAKALGLHVSAYDPIIDHSFAKKNEITISENLEELVKDIDILSLTLPLTSKTTGIINSKIIDKAKKELVIVNTSRALIIDQNCLIEILEKKKIKAYLTDVLEEEPIIKDHPLNKFNNVIITPHIGSRTYQSVERQGLMAVNNLIKSIKKS